MTRNDQNSGHTVGIVVFARRLDVGVAGWRGIFGELFQQQSVADVLGVGVEQGFGFGDWSPPRIFIRPS